MSEETANHAILRQEGSARHNKQDRVTAPPLKRRVGLPTTNTACRSEQFLNPLRAQFLFSSPSCAIGVIGAIGAIGARCRSSLQFVQNASQTQPFCSAVKVQVAVHTRMDCLPAYASHHP